MAQTAPGGARELPFSAMGDTKGSSQSSGDYDYRLALGGDDDEKRANGAANAPDTRPPPIYGGGSGPRTQMDALMNHPALPVACYCASSILMTVVNKFVVSGAHFTMNLLLLAIQSVVCASCVLVCKHAGIITFRDFDINDARKWFPISFLLVLVIYTGSKSLQHLSVPTYTIFKNGTIILIAYGEVLWFSGAITELTLVSFALMILSSIMSAWGDIAGAFSSEHVSSEHSVSLAGYTWMIVNCFVSAGYVLAMRKRIKVTNFRDWDTMFYNNVLAIPVLAFFSLVVEDWSAESLSRNFPAEGRGTLIFAMCFSGGAAVFISYTTAWCVRTTSSTTFSMVGALNKLPVAASGMVFFGDPVTVGSVSSVLTGFIAGLVYAVAKSAQSAKAKMGTSGGSVDLGKTRSGSFQK